MRIPQKQLSLAIINSYSFYASGLSIKESKSCLKNVPGQVLFGLIPSSVNFCLSIELSLKVILSQNNIQFDKTHNISKLYNLLPCAIKLFLEETLAQSLQINKEIIPNKISSISDVFEKWRYYGIDEWQNRQLEFMFCEKMASVLVDFLFKLNSKTAELIKNLDTDIFKK